MAWDDHGRPQCFQTIEAREPVSMAGIWTRKHGLGPHSDIASKENPVRVEPNGRIASCVVRAHRDKLRLDTPEIKVVSLFEYDVGVAELRILEEFGVDR